VKDTVASILSKCASAPPYVASIPVIKEEAVNETVDAELLEYITAPSSAVMLFIVTFSKLAENELLDAE